LQKIEELRDLENSGLKKGKHVKIKILTFKPRTKTSADFKVFVKQKVIPECTLMEKLKYDALP